MTSNNTLKKTLVLGLDKILIHKTCEKASKITIKGSPNLYFSVRPYFSELLSFAASEFEVVVFTSAVKEHSDRILDYLDPEGKISMRLYRENGFETDAGFVKDLRILTRRKLQNIVIVDEIVSFAFQIENGIPILPWFGSQLDTELDKLIGYLKILLNSDIQDTISKTFKLKSSTL